MRLTKFELRYKGESRRVSWNDSRFKHHKIGTNLSHLPAGAEHRLCIRVHVHWMEEKAANQKAFGLPVEPIR